MPTLDAIKHALVNNFRDCVTLDRLSDTAKFDIVKKAKRIGVLLARTAGYKNGEIAEAFGYENAKSLSAVFRRTVKECQGDEWMHGKAQDIAATFGSGFTEQLRKTLD